MLVITLLVIKLSIEDSHRKIVPAYSLKIKVPELVGQHNATSEFTTPQTEPITKVVAVRQVGYSVLAT